MNSIVSRRVFVGSAAAGIPLLVGVSGHGFVESTTGGMPGHSTADGAPDVMLEHLTRRLAGITSSVRRHGPTAEDLRVAAAHLGTLVVYGRHVGLDAQVSAAVRELVRAKGRAAVVDLTVDGQMVQSRMQRYGIDFDERLFLVYQRERRPCPEALDDLSSGGVTHAFARVASTCEHLAAELDRRGDASRVRRVQYDAWQSGVCQALSTQLSYQAAIAAMSCAAGVLAAMPYVDSTCAASQSTLLLLLSVYAALC